MLRKVFVILMIAALGLQSGRETFLFFWYQVARDSFAELFCENLDRPQLQCNGKCQLPKLAEDRQGEPGESSLPPAAKEKTPFFGLLSGEIYRPFFPADLMVSASFSYSFLYRLIPVTGIFHPPR